MTYESNYLSLRERSPWRVKKWRVPTAGQRKFVAGSIGNKRRGRPKKTATKLPEYEPCLIRLAFYYLD